MADDVKYSGGRLQLDDGTLITAGIDQADIDSAVDSATDTLQADIDAKGNMVVLIWVPAQLTYTPTTLLASSNTKLFVGPTDPNTVTGVSLNTRDLWRNDSA